MPIPARSVVRSVVASWCRTMVPSAVRQTSTSTASAPCANPYSMPARVFSGGPSGSVWAWPDPRCATSRTTASPGVRASSTLRWEAVRAASACGRSVTGCRLRRSRPVVRAPDLQRPRDQR